MLHAHADPQPSFNLTNGPSSVSGIVTVNGVGGSYAVRLYDRRTAYFVAETISDSTGHFSFSNLPYGTYYVMAVDHTQNFNIVVADNVTTRG